MRMNLSFVVVVGLMVVLGVAQNTPGNTYCVDGDGGCTDGIEYKPTYQDTDTDTWDSFQYKALHLDGSPQGGANCGENRGDDSKNQGHDPDGIYWIEESQWEETSWDGTIYNPSLMSKQEFAQAICPSGDRPRGLYDLFQQAQPFQDNANPTKAEVDDWHRIVLTHIRRLIGYPESYSIKKDICLYARALWGDQRKFTRMWDDKYPGVDNSAAGPCVSGQNSHCGASFIPDADDQAPYLPDGHPPCVQTQGSEGVTSAAKSNIPWAIKWSRPFCAFLGSEGFWGGHVGPFFHREKFGVSFWDTDTSNCNNNAASRWKWSGQRFPTLYCNPADDGCDPQNTGPESNDVVPDTPESNPEDPNDDDQVDLGENEEDGLGDIDVDLDDFIDLNEDDDVPPSGDNNNNNNNNNDNNNNNNNNDSSGSLLLPSMVVMMAMGVFVLF